MTRMWCVDPRKMCDQHVLGEHNECHQGVGSILRHPHGRAIMEGRVFDDKPDQIDTSRIQDRHDELVDEMEARGMNHDSPMDYEDEWDLGEIDVEYNRQDLSERCEDCFA